MNRQEATKIVIVDPAMMVASGHHAGLASFIASTLPQQKNITLEYICHQGADSEIIQELKKANCLVRPEFSINFYETFDQQVKIPKIQPYLRQTIQEYREVLINTVTKQTCIFFYPTLNWEHAYCLAIALKSLPPINSVHHKVCAMFNPAIDFEKNTLSPISQLNYFLGFNALNKNKSVQIFVSDNELAWQYAFLLELLLPLPIHPCYLANWQQLKNKTSSQYSDNGQKNIILYMGEAKENKGFCSLPELANSILADKNLNIQLYIQYTHLWENAVIEKAAVELENMAKKDKRLTINSHYLSNESIHHQLQTTDLFIFTYNQGAYQNKNSGLLYLSSWYHIPTLFLFPSWLSREAKRLELPSMLISNGTIETKQIQALLRQNNSKPKTNAYSKQIFQSFWDWMVN